MRYILMGLGVLGLAVLTWMAVHFGFDDIISAFESIGWGLALIVLLRVVLICGAGLSWWLLLPTTQRVKLKKCLELRWIRESVNTMLPVAQMGGEFVGARLLAKAGVDRGIAAASVIVDVFVQAATQFFFTLSGLVILFYQTGHSELVGNVLIGLAVLGPALFLFYLAQKFGGFSFMERQIIRAAEALDQQAKWREGEIDAALKIIYRNKRKMVSAVFVHFVVWVVGAGEIWLALHFMGHEVDFAAAVAIESLGQAIRAAAFVVPGGLGVQEGGLIALCAAYGLAAPIGLAVALAKRATESVLGLAGLVDWQRLEGRHWLRKKRRQLTVPPVIQARIKEI